ncbi:MAG: sigma-54 dependent transcriptional regulator [Melioribacteraceae bacterium]|nr:sigma-54 dependent transcriptional regulator [Melioribacteraceae bacterium]MCF8355586.1 sigma-54 dependent transcriptional regulator [Melioribacteraceae bacterium]MCF8395035.1 sigma-54 dependent transcriptional regulator [Melioribacteraceae bacterium]MCF8420489.1 sigma-54 dependent transcriptional regulator [Melioribacteraceae bacterium]
MFLIIDDDIAVQTSLSLLLKQAGYSSLTVSNPTEAKKLLSDDNTIELILLDMNFSLNTTGEEGLMLLSEIKGKMPDVPVILITAWGSIQLAVEGMKRGAADFINKPWNNEHLLQSIYTALRLASKDDKQMNASPTRDKLNQKFNFENIMGEDLKIVKILETVGHICDTNASVLIIGESGTGKELIAEAIHQNSSRKDQPFIKVNLGGISSTLFESEMFGHKRGAFTDAKENRIGRFEAADKGTIFLDEIGDLDLNSQVKLLRVLQDRSFEVLGSNDTKTIDTRVIAATNRDLKSLLSRGEFREDLFYRINLITISIPPLRERAGDIFLLANYFLNNLKIIYERPELRISDSAYKWLAGQPWKGNIRELKNLVERTVLITGKNILDIDDFAEQMQHVHSAKSDVNLPAVGTMSLEEIEVSMINKALSFHDKNINKAARSLGLSRFSLYRRMEKYGIKE